MEGVWKSCICSCISGELCEIEAYLQTTNGTPCPTFSVTLSDFQFRGHALQKAVIGISMFGTLYSWEKCWANQLLMCDLFVIAEFVLISVYNICL